MLLVITLVAQPGGLTVNIDKGDIFVNGIDVYAVYQVRNTSKVILHNLTIAHVYRNMEGKIVGTERGRSIDVHMQPGKTSKVKIPAKLVLEGGFYVKLQATANKKKVEISTEGMQGSGWMKKGPEEGGEK